MGYKEMTEQIAKPLHLQGGVCVHTWFSGNVCGRPVPRDRPNGWLCAVHADQILHGEGVTDGK